MKKSKPIYSIEIYEVCDRCKQLINPDNYNYELDFCKDCIKEMRKEYKRAKH